MNLKTSSAHNTSSVDRHDALAHTNTRAFTDGKDIKRREVRFCREVTVGNKKIMMEVVTTFLF